jgi:putative PEP-CTERM system TPR-repeat lipoprotein
MSEVILSPAATRLCLAGLLLLSGSLLAADDLDRVRALMDEGKARAAMIELKNRLQQDPGDGRARVMLGELHLSMQSGAEAEKELRRAAELGIDPSLWRVKLLDALLMQRKFSDMLDLIDQTVAGADAKARSELLARRGRALSGLERIAEAKEAYSEALALDPENEQAAMGVIMMRLQGEEDPAAVAGDIDRFLEKFPNNADMLVARADLYRRDGELETAKGLFVRAKEQSPSDVRPMIGLATVRVALRELDAAKAELDRIDAIREGLPMTAYLRGLIAFQEQDWESARRHLELVLRTIPGHLQSQLVLGVISFSNNDFQIAEEYLSKVVAAMPSNLHAAKILGATRIKMREPKRAIELLKPIAVASTDAQIMALLGSAYLLDGDEASGQEWLSRAVEEAPDAAALRTQLALTLLAGGNTESAIDELKTAVDLGQDVLQADVLLVLAHVKEGQFEQALEASQALEQRHPDRPLPYNLTGLAFLSQGKLDLAEERFNKALEVDPEFVTALMNLARVDLARGQADRAQKRYEQVLEKRQSDLGAMLGLAALAERRGEAEDLVQWLERAQDANPSSLRPGLALAQHYLNSGDALRALAVARDLSSRFPSNVRVLELLARAQMLSDDKTNAVRTLEQLSDLDPDNHVTQFLIGGGKADLGDDAGARMAFEKAVSIKPDFVQARYALGKLAIKDDRLDQAIKIAEDLSADFPDSAIGATLAGSAYLEQGRTAEAIQSFEAAYGLERTSDTVIALAGAYLRGDRTEDTIRVLEDWTAGQPADTRALALLAQSLQMAGRDGDAIRAYERLLETGRTDYVTLNNLAWLYQEHGDERALEVARQAYDLAPNRPEVADTYGWILVNSGQSKEGLSILQQAYVAFPTQTEIGYHVAVGLKMEGRNEEAATLLRRLLRESPDFPQAEEARALLAELEQ